MRCAPAGSGRFVLCAVLLLVCTGSTPGEELLAEGITHYTYGRYEESIEALTRARAESLEPEQLGQLYLYLGLDYAVLGQQERAEEAFTVALDHDPLLRPDPYRIKPALVQQFEALRTRLQGSTTVETDPRAPEPRVDDGDVGEAPVEAPVEAAPSFWGRDRLWTWVAAGGAVVSFAVAGGLWLAARGEYDDYQDPATPDATARALEEPIRRKVLATNVLLGVGAGLGVTAVLLLFLEGRPDASRSPAVSVGPTGIRLDVSF